MLNHYCFKAAVIALATIGTPKLAVAGGGLPVGATELTQILNNGELLTIGGQNAQQIGNQVTQITNQVTQIANQLKIYQNMLQNTAQLPENIWGQVERDLTSLQGIVQQGQGMAFSMGNLDDALRNRFQSYADFKTNIPDNASYSTMYQSWSDTNRDTISGTLAAANLTAEQFQTEESTMKQLRAQSSSATGQLQALQVGHSIATQQVEQMQKLRGLVSQQVTMMGTWYQAEQTEKDLSRAIKDEFFGGAEINTGSETDFKPDWE